MNNLHLLICASLLLFLLLPFASFSPVKVSKNEGGEEIKDKIEEENHPEVEVKVQFDAQNDDQDTKISIDRVQKEDIEEHSEMIDEEEESAQFRNEEETDNNNFESTEGSEESAQEGNEPAGIFSVPQQIIQGITQLAVGIIPQIGLDHVTQQEEEDPEVPFSLNPQQFINKLAQNANKNKFIVSRLPEEEDSENEGLGIILNTPLAPPPQIKPGSFAVPLDPNTPTAANPQGTNIANDQNDDEDVQLYSDLVKSKQKSVTRLNTFVAPKKDAPPKIRPPIPPENHADPGFRKKFTGGVNPLSKLENEPETPVPVLPPLEQIPAHLGEVTFSISPFSQSENDTSDEPKGILSVPTKVLKEPPQLIIGQIPGNNLQTAALQEEGDSQLQISPQTMINILANAPQKFVVPSIPEEEDSDPKGTFSTFLSPNVEPSPMSVPQDPNTPTIANPQGANFGNSNEVNEEETNKFYSLSSVTKNQRIYPSLPVNVDEHLTGYLPSISVLRNPEGEVVEEEEAPIKRLSVPRDPSSINAPRIGVQPIKVRNQQNQQSSGILQIATPYKPPKNEETPLTLSVLRTPSEQNKLVGQYAVPTDPHTHFSPSSIRLKIPFKNHQKSAVESRESPSFSLSVPRLPDNKQQTSGLVEESINLFGYLPEEAQQQIVEAHANKPKPISMAVPTNPIEHLAAAELANSEKEEQELPVLTVPIKNLEIHEAALKGFTTSNLGQENFLDGKGEGSMSVPSDPNSHFIPGATKVNLKRPQLVTPMGPVEHNYHLAALEAIASSSNKAPILPTPVEPVTEAIPDRIQVFVNVAQHLAEIQLQQEAESRNDEMELDEDNEESESGIVNALGNVFQVIGQVVESIQQDGVLEQVVGQIDSAISQAIQNLPGGNRVVTTTIFHPEETHTVTTYNTCYSQMVTMDECLYRSKRLLSIIQEKPVVLLEDGTKFSLDQISKASSFRQRYSKQINNGKMEGDLLGQQPASQDQEEINSEIIVVDLTETINSPPPSPSQSQSTVTTTETEEDLLGQPLASQDQEEIYPEIIIADPTETTTTPHPPSQFQTTVTTTLTASVVLDGGFQTLRFTSDAQNPGCLPEKLLKKNKINPC